MSELSWQETIRRVHDRADRRCEYCQTSQQVIGQAMHVEHILPDGGDTLDQLCLSCANCNLSKGKATTELDPLTEETVQLFNPRQQEWDKHFQWIAKGKHLEGLSPIGRATIIRLKMNQPRIVMAREIWILAGVHPPQADYTSDSSA